MPKYAPIGSTNIDPRALPPEAPSDSPISDSFEAGLRSGLTRAGGQFQALAGGVGEALGADQFAANRYAASKAAEAQANAEAPAINDYHQIDGLRSGAQFLAGQAGQLVPTLGMGVAGALAAPAALPAAGLVGMTAGMTPSMVGSAIQRQQASPEALTHGAGERLAMATGEGLADSAISSVVPMWMGGKLVGRGVAGATAQLSKKALLGQNLAEGVLGNATASTGSEALHQAADSHFDPNRDTSQDSQNLLDAGATGAIVGAPFGAVGLAGALAHRPGVIAGVKDGLGSIAGSVKDKLGSLKGDVADKATALPETAGDAAQSVKDFATAAADKASGAASSLYDTLPDTWKEHIDKTAAFLKESAVSKASKLHDWGQELTADPIIPDNIKSQIQTAAANIKDTANQAFVASMRFARDKFDATKDGDFGTWLGSQVPKPATVAADNMAARARSIFDKNEPVDLQAARDIAAGKDGIESIDPAAFDAASPDAQQAMADQAQSSTADKVAQMAKDLYNDHALSPESRAALDSMQGDFSSAANRMKVASIRLAQAAQDRTVGLIDETHKFISEQYQKRFANDPTAKSEMGEGIRQVVSDTIMPFLQQHRPEILGNDQAVQRIGDSVRMMAAVATKGDIDMQAVRYMHSIFGGKTLRDILMQVHDAVNSDADPAATQNFMKTMGKIQNEEITSSRLTDAVKGGLDKEVLQQNVAQNPDYLNTMVNGIRAHVDESAYRGMSKARADIDKVDFNLGMQKEFGSKAKGILAMFAKEAEANSPGESHMAERGSMTDAENGSGAGLGDDIGENGHAARRAEDGSDAQLSDEFDTPRFTGTDSGQMVMDPKTHRSIFGNESPAERILSRVSQKNPDRASEFVSSKDIDPKSPEFLKTTEMIKAKRDKDEGAHNAAEAKAIEAEVAKVHEGLVNTAEKRVGNGKALTEKKIAELRAQAEKTVHDEHASRPFVPGPEHDIANYGMVRTEGMKQEGRLTPDEFKTMTIDSTKTSHLNSPSRIDTGVKGAILDARAMVKMFQSEKRTPFMDGAESGRERLAHVFKEAVAAAQDHLGKAFEVPDDTALNHSGTTWGEVKHLAIREKDPAWMKGKTDEQINRRLADSEVLTEMTGKELGKHREDLRDSIAELEGAVQAKADEMVRTRMHYEGMYKDLNEELGLNNVRAEMAAVSAEVQKRQIAAGKERVLDSKGATEPDPHASIVGAALVGDKHAYGESRISPWGKRIRSIPEDKDIPAGATGRRALTKAERSATTDSGEASPNLARRTDYSDQPVNHSAIPERGPEALAKKIDSMITKLGERASPAAKAMAESLQHLNDVIDLMRPADKKAFVGVLETATKPSQLAPLLSNLMEKYGNARPKEAKPPSEPASQWKGSTLKKADAQAEGEKAGPRSMQQVGSQTLSEPEQRSIKAHLASVLGPKIEVRFAKMLHSGDYERIMKNYKGVDLIRLSVHALDPMGTAFHESLHAFIQHMREADLHGVNKALFKAADSIVVHGQLRKMLANEPEALKQIEGSSEERAAYMYQFWATKDINGKRLLEVGSGPRNILQRIGDFLKQSLGMWTSDQRAQSIMEYFNSGEYAKTGIGEPSAVSRAVLERGTSKTFEAIKKNLAPVARLSVAVASAGDARLGRLHNPAIDQIRNAIHSNTSDTGKDVGFISAQRTERTQTLNRLMSEFAKIGTDKNAMREAIEQLQSGKVAGSAEGRLTARAVRSMLDDMFVYMDKAGVNVKDLGFGKDYFPVVWDSSFISANQKDFRAMLDKYVRSGKIHPANVDEIIHRLISNDGNEFGIETSTPGMQFLKDRKLDFIAPEDRAPFLQKDLARTLDSYVTQATRRGEWARRFGKTITDPKGGEHRLESGKLDELWSEAQKKHGASSQDMDELGKYLQGVGGTLGDDINPDLRRLFGNAIVYQNIRLLPLAVFSMAVDPGGIMVRGGTVGDAFTAFKRGITEVKRGFQKDPKKDEWYQLSELMGTIDNSSLMQSLGSSYAQGMVGDTGRKINDTYFKYNLVEQMNTSMRVAALPAALKFIQKHADGSASTHSARWLDELGLKPNEVIMGEKRPLLTFDEFKDHGMSNEQALSMSLKMRGAVNKWVDGAILRPNAAHKPVWMNDPHYALIAHLKQFIYSFNETIIKRVINEARYGNYSPAMALASYVPMMMASDFIKGMLVGGGSQPNYKESWDLGDYVGDGMQRAGLFGVTQFGIDAYEDIKFGGLGVGALAGPMAEQAYDGVKALGGQSGSSKFMLDALPAATLVKAVAGDSSKADPTFAD